MDIAPRITVDPEIHHGVPVISGRRVPRLATLAFFRNLPEEAWMRGGTASGNSFTLRALAYILAGHVAHHTAILLERYL